MFPRRTKCFARALTDIDFISNKSIKGSIRPEKSF